MSKKYELSVPFGNDLHSVILTQQELEKVQSGGVLTKQFKDTMERMDTIRNENILEVFPELKELYETY